MSPVVITRAAIVLGLALTSACATTQASAAAEPDAVWPGVSLAGLHFPAHATQVLTLTRPSQTFDFTAILERDETHVVVAGMASMGPRLFRITKSAQGVKGEASPLVPSSFRPEHLLADLELAFAPTKSISDSFAGTRWALSESGLVRTSSFDGRPVTTVTRTTEDPWAGPLDLDNVRFGYRLHVETIEREE